MSIATSDMEVPHIHGLKDDLESLLYVVLYCALLWLPVATSKDLDWWLTRFFSVQEIGSPFKQLNAAYRTYSKGLESTQNQAVLDWLSAAMDLHHHAQGGPNPIGPNPAWDDGKALEDMWKKSLEGELPEDDRHMNPVPDMAWREGYSLHLTTTERSAF